MNSKVLKYLILVAFVLVIVSISSFWFSGPSFREKDVVLEIEGPTQVSSGDEVVYKLKYQNLTRSILTDIDLIFFYPEGSTVVSGGSVQEDHNENFTIDNLASGEKGEKEFRAFMLGERGNIKIAKAVLSFKAGNLKSSFEKTVSLSTTIVETPISLSLAAPPSAVSGQIINYTLDYRNQTDEEINDLVLEFDYPDGFRPVEFNPEPSGPNNIWNIKVLKKNGAARIAFKGVLDGQEGENKILVVKVKRKIGGDYVDYQKTSAATVISNPVLGLEVLVNKLPDYSAYLGDRLSYTINYSNNSNLSLSGMNVTVKLEGDMFDFSTLDTRGGLFDDATKTIRWDATTVSDFINLFPNQKGQLTFSIPIKSFFSSVVSGASKDRFVKASVKFFTNNVPVGSESDELGVSSSIVTKIGTQPAFNKYAYYDDFDFGSSGPFPLRVGEETSFTIRWHLSNPGNAVEGAKIIGKLSAGVQWADMVKVSDGQPSPTYNPNTSEVTWNIGTLPYGAGLSGPKFEAAFKVKVKPSSIQRGTVVSLIENIQFTGLDSFTKQDVTISGGGLTTNDLVDRPREGIVQ